MDLAACPVWMGRLGFGFALCVPFLPSCFDISGAGAHEHTDTVSENYIV